MSKQPTPAKTSERPSAADQALLRAIADLPSDPGPPAALDEAILAASRRAVRARPMARLKPWLSAAAAVFVAFFAANLLLTERASDSINKIERAAPAAEPEVTVVAELLEDGQGADHATSAENEPFAGDFESARSDSLSEPASAALIERRQSMPGAAEGSGRSGQLMPKADAPAPPAAKPAAPPARREEAAPEPVFAPSPPVLRKALPEPFPADIANGSTAPAEPIQPQEADNATAAFDDAPGRSRLAAPAPPQSSRRDRRADDEGAASGPAAAAAPQFVQPAAPAAAATNRSSEEVPALTLEQWLERLRRLQAEGQSDQAQALMDEFRAAYPQFQLPEDLRWLEAAEQ